MHSAKVSIVYDMNMIDKIFVGNFNYVNLYIQFKTEVFAINNIFRNK